MIQIVVVLDQEQYSRLIQKVGYTTGIDNNSTAEMIAYKLGVQHVLNALRTGFVVGAIQEPKPESLWVRIKNTIRGAIRG